MIKPRILVCCFFLLLPCLSSAAPVNASCARMPTEKDRRRVERLIRALSHPEFEERECATELLVREGSAVLKYLKPLFRSGNPEIVYRARRIFQEIRGFTPETEERVLRLVEKLNDGPVGEARNEVREIVEAGPAAVEFAVGLLSRLDNDYARSFKDELLVERCLYGFARGERLKDFKALRGIGKRGRSLLAGRSQERGEAPPVRVFALNVLRKVSPEAAKSVALNLLKEPEASVRQTALLILTELAGKDDFVRVAELEGSVEGRSFLEGRRLVESVGRKLDSETLRRLLLDGSDRVKAAAAWCLGLRKDKESRRRLTSLLKEESPLVRAEAARALSAMGEKKDLAVIGRALREETEPETAAVFLEALFALGKESLPWIAASLRHPDPFVRRRAAVLLGRAGEKKTLPALVATLGDADPWVEKAVLLSLRRVGGVKVPGSFSLESREERRRAVEKVRRWWAKNRGKIVGKESVSGLPATEGGKILGRIEEILADNFLSVKWEEEKEEKSAFRFVKDKEKKKKKDIPPEVKDENLKKAALSAFREFLDARKDDFGEEDRDTLRFLFSKGSFRDLADTAEFTGALPVSWDRKRYVELVNAAAKAVVESLGDPFSRILISHDAEGRFSKEIIPLLFGGAKTNGVMLRRSDEDVLVDFVLSGGPAFRAGLRYGDRVVLINGKPAGGFSHSALKEAVNKKVKFTVFRQGWTRPFAFELEPEEVFSREPVRYAVLPGKIGYVWLQYFGQGTDTKVEWAFRELEKQGIKGLVFDLRNNPGGLVVVCTNIIDKFLKGGRKITVLKPRSDKGKEEEQEIKSSSSETDRDYPLVVLINHSSASASELMAGTLQDLKRAVLVGERTYGKGIGQQGFVVPGFTGKSIIGKSATFYLLSVTTMRYFFPSGGNPHGVGVEPDREVRPFLLRGDRFTAVYRLVRSKAFKKYVEELAKRKDVLEIARWDGKDPGSYPGFEDFYKKLKKPPSREDVRRALRRALREKTAGGKEKEALADLIDLVDDRVLLAGLEEAASKLEVEDIKGEIRKFFAKSAGQRGGKKAESGGKKTGPESPAGKKEKAKARKKSA